MLVRTFGGSILVTLVALAVAFAYGGASALLLCLVLGVLEVSLSLDNAIVNATVLRRMSALWQRLFLTVGIVIAVFGMRVLFPLLLVGVTARIGPVEAVRLALERRPPSDPGSYAALLADAHPQIAAFGGMFLAMVFLEFILAERDITWLDWVEKPLARLGRVNHMSVILAGAGLLGAGQLVVEERETLLLAGLLGMLTYLMVHAVAGLVESEAPGTGAVVLATGRAGLAAFCYLELLDAAFSFDGVVGAFAITSDPVVIALGLGLIGAMFVRSFTVYLVRRGTLENYVYLEHGAHWAIGALAVVLLLSIRVHIDEVVTGLLGLAVIVAAFLSSVLRNRREAAAPQVTTTTTRAAA